jgi:tetratricopeptide (TPR) repeat protein
MIKKIALFTVVIMVLGFALPCCAFENFDDAYKTGVQKYKEKNYETAYESFKEALKLSEMPNHRFLTQLYIGHIYYNQGKNQEAITEYKKALDIEGIKPQQKFTVMLRLIYSNYREKQYDEVNKYAAEILKSEASSDVRKGVAHYYSGLVLIREKNYAQARECFKKVLEIEKTSPNYKSNAHFQIGHTYKSEKQYDKAVEEYKKMLEIEKAPAVHKSNAYLNIGQVFFAEKKYDEAREAFQKVIDMQGARPAHVKRAESFISKIDKIEK